MVSKVSIIGIPIFLSGIVILLLFTVIGVAFYPFGFAAPAITGDPVTVTPGNIETIELTEGNARLPTLPLWAFAKTSFKIESFSDLDFELTLTFEGSIQQDLFSENIFKFYSGDGSAPTELVKTNTITLTPAATSSSYTFTITIRNFGIDDLTIGNRSVKTIYSLTSTIFPLILALIGIVVIIVGFIVSRGKPSTTKRKKQVTTPGGWEPTLQWGGGSAKTGTTKAKKPRMAIKSTKTSVKTNKKVVQGPTGGAQASCKFCGKNVPSSAFFCPHCYGKLR